ncbi:uncharacterized protein [Bemisia tabaci]|uniref:uncharacterized protein isoform X2 n=1 Tax=Bemisia tabaci TaxID=7038 RepID=UPI003B280356
MCSRDRSCLVIKRVKQEASVSRPSLQYRIQYVDESMIEEAAAFMIEHLLPNDNLDRSLGTIDDDEAIDEAYSDWKMLLSKGTSLAAILEDDEGRRDRMISCNVLEIQKKEQPPPPAEHQHRHGSLRPPKSKQNGV